MVSTYRLIALFLLQAWLAFAVPKNFTIDDHFGDSMTGRRPTYTPLDNWLTAYDGHGGGIAQPDPERVYMGSWHDSMDNLEKPPPNMVTVTFRGTAVYAYCILADGIGWNTNLTFLLDGLISGTFVHIPDPAVAYRYNVSVYSNNSLADDEHTFQILTNGRDATSFVLFDYVVYTFDSDGATSSSSPPVPSPPPPSSLPPPATSHSPSVNIGGVVGGTLGGLALLVILLTCFLLRRRRRTDEVIAANETIQEFHNHVVPSTILLEDSDTRVQNDMPSVALSTARIYQSHSPTKSVPQSSAISRTPVPTANSIVMRSAYYGETPYNASSASGTGPASSNRSGFARDEDDISRQIREREQHIAELQSLRIDSPAPVGRRDGAMLAQINALQREMEQLRAQQREMAWAIQETAPPQYDSEGVGDILREQRLSGMLS